MFGHHIRGFTLVELLVALVLLALMSTVLYGTLSLVADTWDRGEAKSQQTSQMRLTEEFLRSILAAAQPLHPTSTTESPFPFIGTDSWVAFPASLPRHAGGGLYYFKLALTPSDKDSKLSLEYVIPQYNSVDPPNFRQVDVPVLAEGIHTLKLQYFGSVYQNGPDPSPPIWRNDWDDRRQWPELIRIDVTPAQGPKWPTLLVKLELGAQTVCDEIRRAHNMCDAN